MRIECYKYTNDESWHPSYPGNKVKVSLLSLTNGKTRVCVWGNDDFGMEIDSERQGTAKSIYYEVCMMEFVTKEALEMIGFKIA